MALGTFLLVGAGLATASLTIASALTRAEARLVLVDALDSRLAQVATLPYDQLVDGTFVAPDRCDQSASSGDANSTSGSSTSAVTPRAQRSCIRLGTSRIEVSYEVNTDATLASESVAGVGIAPPSLTITASATLPDLDGGTRPEKLSRSRQVVVPLTGYSSSEATVRIRLAGAGRDFDLPIVVVDRSGAAVTDALRFTNGLAVTRIDPSRCSGAAAPCRVGLASGSAWYTAGGWTLSPSDIAGPGSRLVFSPSRPGQTAEVAVTPSLAGRAVIRILAQSPTGGSAAPGAAAGSVCLWVTLDSLQGRRATPACNAGPSSSGGGEIVVDRYLALVDTNGGKELVALPLPAGTQLTGSVDNPDATCPTRGAYPAPLTPQGSYRGLEDLLGASDSGGWSAADVCTGWTWGAPSRWGETGTTLSAPGSSWPLIVTATGRTYDLVWTDTDGAGSPVGRPAAGSDSVAIWSKPRAASLAGPAQGCATDGLTATLCTSPLGATTAPEVSGGCSLPFCYSRTAVPPAFTSPRADTAIRVSAVTTAPSYFSLDAVDADGENLTLTVDSLPTTGTLSRVTGPASLAALTAGTTIGPVGPQAGFALAYQPSVALTGLERFSATLTDTSGRSTSRTFHLYTVAQPYSVSFSPLSIAQGQANASPSQISGTVTVTDTSGAAASGATVAITSSLAGVSVTPSVSTDAKGTASFAVTAAASAPATSSPLGLTATLVNGRQGVGALSVTPTLASIGSSAVGSLALTAPGTLPQGTSGTVTVTARDGAGSLLDGVAVVVEARSGDGTEALDKRAAVRGGGPCVTGSSSTGTCQVAVDADIEAPEGSYALRAQAKYGALAPAGGVVWALSPSFAVTSSLARLVLGPSGSCSTPADSRDSAAADITLAQGASVPVTVTACSGSGQALSAQTLTALNVAGSALTLSPASIATADSGAAAGRASFTLSAANSTRSSAAPASSSLPLPVAPSVTGANGAVSVNIAPITVTAAVGTLTAGAVSVTGGSSTTVAVTVRDKAGDLMAGARVGAATSAGAVPADLEVARSAVSGVDGVARLRLRAKAGSSPATLSLTLAATTSGSGGAGASAVVPVTISSSAYSVVPRTARTTYSQGTTVPLELEVRNRTGSGVGSVTLAPSCNAARGCSGLSFSPTSAVSDADGRATFTVTVATSATVGENPVTVVVNSASLDVPLVVAARPVAICINGLANPGTIPLRLDRANSLVVTVLDSSCPASVSTPTTTPTARPVAGVAVWATVSSGAATVRPGRSDGNGSATLTVTPTQAGPLTLVVRAGSLAPVTVSAQVS